MNQSKLIKTLNLFLNKEIIINDRKKISYMWTGVYESIYDVDYEFAKRVVDKNESIFFNLDCGNWEDGNQVYLFIPNQLKKFEKSLDKFLTIDEMKTINRYKKLKRILK
jgi:hypothetical protein